MCPSLLRQIGASPGARFVFGRAQHQSISGDTVLTVYLPDTSSGIKGSGGGGGHGDGDSSSGNDDGPHAGEVSSFLMLCYSFLDPPSLCF